MIASPEFHADIRIVACHACDGAGRIVHEHYTDVDRTSGWEEPCDCCRGEGVEEIEAEPVTLDDLEDLAEMEAL